MGPARGKGPSSIKSAEGALTCTHHPVSSGDRVWAQRGVSGFAISYTQMKSAADCFFTGTVTDISSEKGLEVVKLQAVEQRAADAEAHRKQIENFIDITSHELRNRASLSLHFSPALSPNPIQPFPALWALRLTLTTAKTYHSFQIVAKRPDHRSVSAGHHGRDCEDAGRQNAHCGESADARGRNEGTSTRTKPGLGRLDLSLD